MTPGHFSLTAGAKKWAPQLPLWALFPAPICWMSFSHWLLDLLVHRPDLPILPGNFGNLPLLGFGVWEYPLIRALIELVLVVGGAILYYYQSSVKLSNNRRRAVTAGWVTGSLLLLLFITNTLGL